MRALLSCGVVCALVAGMSAPAEAMTASVTVTANRSGGNTTFTVKVCVCMSGLEVINYNSHGGGGSLQLNLTSDACVTGVICLTFS